MPVVLTRQEVLRLFDHHEGMHHLIATVLSGSGLRLMEGLRLRVKDLDLGYDQITVRDGRGAKDRVTMLPSQAKDALRHQLRHTRELKSVETTMVYTHVLNRGGRGVRSPPDRL